MAGGIERPTGGPSALAGADADVREAAIARASAEVVLEQSRATQDYTVGGGLRFMRETNDVALVAGISIPLGRFDHNDGHIERDRKSPRLHSSHQCAIRMPSSTFKKQNITHNTTTL